MEIVDIEKDHIITSLMEDITTIIIMVDTKKNITNIKIIKMKKKIMYLKMKTMTIILKKLQNLMKKVLLVFQILGSVTKNFLKLYQVIQIWKIKKIIISSLIHHIIFMNKCLKIEKEQELIKMQF